MQVLNYAEETQESIEEYQYLLYKTYYKDVFRTIYYIVKNKEVAKELTNDAYLKAFENMHSLKNLNKVKSWICVIASNLAKNYMKKNNRVISLDNIDYISTSYDIEDDIIKSIEKKEDLNKLKQVLQDLDPDSKQIIIMRYYKELSYKSICEQLNLKIGTVKSRINRAKEKIYNLLKKEGDIND